MEDGKAPAGMKQFEGGDDAAWRRLVDRMLAGRPFSELVGRTEEGLAVQPLMAAGTGQPIGGRGARAWHRLQRIDHPDSQDANRAALEALEGGASGLSLVFSGAPSARGYGLEPQELEAVLGGVRIDACTLRLEGGADGIEIAGVLHAIVERQRIDPALVDLSFGIDPIGAIAATGDGLSHWQERAAALPSRLANLAARRHKGPFLAADGRRVHEAGADAATELAVVTATAAAYLRLLLDGPMDDDAALRSIELVLAIDTDLFTGIAKIRAARRLWARLLAAAGLPAVPVRIHAETSFRMLARRDPHSNLVRATLAAFAAGAGGADSISVLPYSAALGLPDADARRLALNTQSLLAEETELWRLADPAAGAGSLDALTEDIGRTAWEGFRTIERDGGMPAALASGRLQAEIARSHAARRASLADGRTVLVGVTRFQRDTESEIRVAGPFRDEPTPSAPEIEPLRSRRTAALFEADAT